MPILSDFFCIFAVEIVLNHIKHYKFMVTIQISNETNEKVSFSLSAESLRMISRFLNYASYANHDLYSDYTELQIAVADFYDSDYDPTLLRNFKFLKCMFDLFTENLC